MSGFVPQKIDKEIISIRISTDMLKKLDNLSAKYEISRNEFINQCIQYAIDHMDDSNND